MKPLWMVRGSFDRTSWKVSDVQIVRCAVSVSLCLCLCVCLRVSQARMRYSPELHPDDAEHRVHGARDGRTGRLGSR